MTTHLGWVENAAAITIPGFTVLGLLVVMVVGSVWAELYDHAWTALYLPMATLVLAVIAFSVATVAASSRSQQPMSDEAAPAQ